MRMIFSLFISFLIVLLHIEWETSSVYSVTIDNVNNSDHRFLQESIAQILDLGSGVFAAFILLISLIAYRKFKTKRLLFISAAFALFCLRSILSRLGIFLPETLELLLAIASFTGLVFFFIAILQMGKLGLKKTPPS